MNRSEDGGAAPLCQLCCGTGKRKNHVTGKVDVCPCSAREQKFNPGPITAGAGWWKQKKPKPKPKVKKTWKPKAYPAYESKTCGALYRCPTCGGIHPEFNCPSAPRPEVSTEPWQTPEWWQIRRRSEAAMLERQDWNRKHGRFVRGRPHGFTASIAAINAARRST